MASLPIPVKYQRLGAFPIDETSVFETYAQLEDYAQNNGTAYAGQICSVIEENETKVYKINSDKSLQLLGEGGGAEFPATSIKYIDGNRTDDYVEDGSLSHPYKTISDAITNSDVGVEFFIYPATYNENIEPKDNQLFFSISSGIDSRVFINDIVLNGKSGVNVRGIDIKDVTISGNGGLHRFTECNIENITINRISGGNVIFTNCYISGDITNSNNDATGYPVIIKGLKSTTCDIINSSPTAVTYIQDSMEVGAIIHNSGAMFVRNVGLVAGNGTHFIRSTPDAGGYNYLLLENVSLAQLNGTYGVINKTGTCPYQLNDVNRNTVNDILSGTKVYGRFSVDIFDVVSGKSISSALQDKVEIDDAQTSDSFAWSSAKIMEEIGNIETARKVLVVDETARLALDEYPELTIAHQTDDGTTWALNANTDPSVAGNWTQIGAVLVDVVNTFNGRSGNVLPEEGDYEISDIAGLSDALDDKIDDADSDGDVYARKDGDWVKVNNLEKGETVFVGNGTQDTFDLVTVEGRQFISVSVGGAAQSESAYSIVGTDIVFTEPVPNGARIVVSYLTGSVIG